MPYKDKGKQKEYQRRHYLDNKKKYQEYRYQNRKKRAAWFRNLKSQQKCIVCGCNDLRCLDFHHKNPEDKIFGVSIGVKFACSEKRILNEIAKCDVLCANCHIKYHYGAPKEGYIRPGLRWVCQYKKELVCLDCGINDSSVLAFHHVRGVKNETISHLVFYGRPIEEIIEEIKKCEVLCANCHRIRHNGMIWEEDSLLRP